MSEFHDNTVNSIDSHLEISSRFHEKNLIIPSHWHDYFEFEIVTDGLYEHIISGKTHLVSRGCAWIMSYLDCHRVKSLENSSLINISFTSDAVSSEISEILASNAGGFLCRFDEATADKIISMCMDADRDLTEKPALWKNSVTGLVENIMIKTIRQAANSADTSPEKSPDILRRIIPYINKNFREDISIAEISKKFGISPGRLGLLFSKSMGMSYNSYVNRIRLRHACNLLTATDKSAKEIAFDSGYSSTEYFFYVFKKELMTTPGLYRQNNGKGLET